MTSGIDHAEQARRADDHVACVDAWMERAVVGLSPEDMLLALERGFAALWRRAHQTLGDVTLAAIADRVLHDTATRYPLLSALELDPNGLRCPALHESPDSLHEDQLVEGIRFVVAEFLTVLGSLTADILTPSLHAALSRVARGAAGHEDRASQNEALNPARTEREDAKS